MFSKLDWCDAEDGAETASVATAVVVAVRLELSLLEWELVFGSFGGSSAAAAAAAGGGSAGAAAAGEDLGLEERLDFRQPPPTGTLRRTPPLVQYLRQLLQKWRGWEPPPVSTSAHIPSAFFRLRLLSQ